jgi:hypothetical protein
VRYYITPFVFSLSVPVTVSSYEVEINQQYFSKHYGISLCQKRYSAFVAYILNGIIVSPYNSGSNEGYSTEMVTMGGNYLEALE